MKILLRSTFRVEHTDDPDLLLANILDTQAEGLEFLIPEHQSIWEFIRTFVRTHNHAPDISTLTSHFRREKENDVIDQLEILKQVRPLFRGDFRARLYERSEERLQAKLQERLMNANQINMQGLKLPGKDGKDRIFKGPRDAISYFQRESSIIGRPPGGMRTDGEVTEDTEDYWEDYKRRRDDPNFGIGQYMGIKQIDVALGGARKKQLWTHAGFTGHMKSSVAFNWVYNQAIFFKYSSCYFTLEMSYDQCRRIIVAMHSMHPKFRDARIRLGIQRPGEVDLGLRYRYLRDGSLPPNEEEFLTQLVLPDLRDPSNGYGKMHFVGYNPDDDSFRVSDIRSKSELLYRQSPFNLIVVDHVLLVDPKQYNPSTTARANEVVRDLKILSSNFNRGEGIAVVALFQISREGFKRANMGKNGGRVGIYEAYDLSYSNEIERSSDIITAGYLNDTLRKNNRLLVQCVKTRDDEKFEPIYTAIDWRCRRIMTCTDPVDFEALANSEKAEETVRKAEELSSFDFTSSDD